MPRYFGEISPDGLRKKVEEAKEKYKSHLKDLTPQVEKDLSKVQFDTENLEDGSYGVGYGPGKGLVGYNTLPNNGMVYLGITAGGDWEHPIFFIIYWDGKQLRGYIPEKGNTWNTDTKQAYGNDYKADVKNCKKRWPELYKDVEYKEDEHGLPIDEDDLDPPHNTAEIMADIASRILPKPVTAKEKKEKDNRSMSERLEDLTYYGTGCEGVELFQALCSACYKMYGIGDPEKAELLYQWAKEDAEASKQWCIQEGWDLSDTCSGSCY
ncbi:hypothetical protein C4577_02195 [Candidatus Parcubacteria bacterium]|nr:MAG: hypothetical protein C4577_02195 [Candidatus Parcubacteria bacterium]